MISIRHEHYFFLSGKMLQDPGWVPDTFGKWDETASNGNRYQVSFFIVFSPTLKLITKSIKQQSCNHLTGCSFACIDDFLTSMT